MDEPRSENEQDADEQLRQWAKQNGFALPEESASAANKLIHCSGCGHTVHVEAIACPGCGLAPSETGSDSEISTAVPATASPSNIGKSSTSQPVGFSGPGAIASIVVGVAVMVVCSGILSVGKKTQRPTYRGSSTPVSQVGNRAASNAVLELLEPKIRETARGFLPVARQASRLSLVDNEAAERLLDRVVRPHARRDPTMTDSSFAKDGLCQVCFDYDDTSIAGQICVTARDDGYEHVDVQLWAK